MAKSADRYFGLDTRKIIEKGFDPAHALESESIFSLANEHMGVRGYFEEGGTLPSLRGSYLGGVYETQRHKPDSDYKGFVHSTHYMVTAADALATKLVVGGEMLDLGVCEHSDFVRVLDMRTGLLTRSFIWKTKASGAVEVRFERLLSMPRPEVLSQRITLCALERDASVQLTLAMDGNMLHQTTGKCLWEDVPDGGEDCVRLTLKTASTGIVARYTQRVVCAGERKLTHGYRLRGESYQFTLQRGVETAIERTVCVQVAHGGEALPTSLAAPAFATLLSENAAHWETFWDMSDVEIGGDTLNQQGVRYCLFQLHSTYRGLSPRDNIGAKGLTGEAYNGHAFWDTETYGLPFYLLSDPAAARHLLLYRYHTLPQAMERARQLDLVGACYPIATMDGTEACTLWQHSSLQMQPSTSVAYAIQTYADMTGDTAFLHREGAEMLVQIARYVLARGGWNEQGFGFYGVMGPDEFHMMVSNDFYTNYLGKKTLAYAAEVIGSMHGEALDALRQKTGLADGEAAAWREAAEKMILLRRADGVFEQHEGYFSLPHIDVQTIPVTDFPLYDHWSYDRIYRTDMLKQPDVLMAMFLYPDDFTRAEKDANYAWYEPRCIHESSLSPSVHAIIACELGRREEALRFFGFATRLDLDNYNRNTRDGLHLSSVAAAWMTIVEGFGGVRFENGALSLAPWLPEHWTRLRFGLRVRDSLLRVTLAPEGLTLVSEGEPISLSLYGQQVTVGHTPLVTGKAGA